MAIDLQPTNMHSFSPLERNISILEMFFDTYDSFIPSLYFLDAIHVTLEKKDKNMRILIINPNTTKEFTRKIQDIADQYRLPTTTVVATNPERGPRSIECVYDELLSAPGTLEIGIAEMDQSDGIVIACYSDHSTIYALRELGDVPVIGIAEASMYVACMLGYRFSVVTTGEAWEPLLWDAVRHYGLEQRCASVRSTQMSVLDLEEASPEKTNELVTRRIPASH